MPRGSKDKYTDKQKRKAEHIEEGFEQRGVGREEAERRAWATVNAQDGGGREGGRLAHSADDDADERPMNDESGANGSASPMGRRDENDDDSQRQDGSSGRGRRSSGSSRSRGSRGAAGRTAATARRGRNSSGGGRSASRAKSSASSSRGKSASGRSRPTGGRARGRSSRR